jgi:type I restriction enzyme, R subunit
MAFNELNSVEHFIIHQLSGKNLNSTIISEPQPVYGSQWKYQSAAELQRGIK